MGLALRVVVHARQLVRLVIGIPIAQRARAVFGHGILVRDVAVCVVIVGKPVPRDRVFPLHRRPVGHAAFQRVHLPRGGRRFAVPNGFVGVVRKNRRKLRRFLRAGQIPQQRAGLLFPPERVVCRQQLQRRIRAPHRCPPGRHAGRFVPHGVGRLGRVDELTVHYLDQIAVFRGADVIDQPAVLIYFHRRFVVKRNKTRGAVLFLHSALKKALCRRAIAPPVPQATPPLAVYMYNFEAA